MPRQNALWECFVISPPVTYYWFSALYTRKNCKNSLCPFTKGISSSKSVPAAIMLVTTITALGYQVYNFSTAEEPDRLLAVVSVILICLALFLTYTALAAVAKLRKNDSVQEATDG